LQPGGWGRFKGLPLRKDVVEGLINQGVTVLRYGGSMVNAPEYRWKKMIGPRDRRPPYHGTWYPYSSNGWGIIDFLDLCEAAGFLGVPAFNMDESPADMADFIEYVNGPADGEWGRKRVADGHPKPYGLKYLELGNEERVDERYVEKFAALTRAIWANDPQVIPVVGDFAYDAPIQDPMHVTRAASRITSLTGHQQILKLSKEQGREVWFDVHVWTEGPAPYPSLTALPTYIDAIDKLADGAKHKVVVFELNANNHSQKRAVGNAQALGVAMRDGRLPIVTSANCLQVDGQNDNGWDQGLLFLNPSKVWLQPPGYVTKMLRQAYQPTVIDAAVQPVVKDLDVTATRSEDGKEIVLRVVNIGAEPQSASIALDGLERRQEVATIERLAADADAANTAEAPERVVPKKLEWRHKTTDGRSAALEFPPHSLTVVRFR
jgi:alpha-L-arabinofuranosidase